MFHRPLVWALLGMVNWSALLARFISMLMSWMDASNLRDRVYTLQDRIDTLHIALDDIQRMTPDPKIKALCKRAREQ